MLKTVGQLVGAMWGAQGSQRLVITGDSGAECVVSDVDVDVEDGTVTLTIVEDNEDGSSSTVDIVSSSAFEDEGDED